MAEANEGFADVDSTEALLKVLAETRIPITTLQWTRKRTRQYACGWAESERFDFPVISERFPNFLIDLKLLIVEHVSSGKEGQLNFLQYLNLVLRCPNLQLLCKRATLHAALVHDRSWQNWAQSASVHQVTVRELTCDCTMLYQLPVAFLAQSPLRLLRLSDSPTDYHLNLFPPMPRMSCLQLFAPLRTAQLVRVLGDSCPALDSLALAIDVRAAELFEDCEAPALGVTTLMLTEPFLDHALTATRSQQDPFITRFLTSCCPSVQNLLLIVHFRTTDTLLHLLSAVAQARSKLLHLTSLRLKIASFLFALNPNLEAELRALAKEQLFHEVPVQFEVCVEADVDLYSSQWKSPTPFDN
jgi:hypothetical protein